MFLLRLVKQARPLLIEGRGVMVVMVMVIEKMVMMVWALILGEGAELLLLAEVLSSLGGASSPRQGVWRVRSSCKATEMMEGQLKEPKRHAGGGGRRQGCTIVI